jgi:Protein of unknown function (DUF3306)
MSELENFLTRWSARKLAKDAQATQHDTDAAQRSREEGGGAVENRSIVDSRQDCNEAQTPPFDPASLPPLESIGPATNVAAFLGREVPAELARAALRRAWTSDPAIRDFVGLVENGWDFNDASAMTGFGPISAEEVARLAGKLIDALPEAKTAPADQSEKEPIENEAQAASTKSLPTGELEASRPVQGTREGDGVAAQQNAESDDVT